MSLDIERINASFAHHEKRLETLCALSSRIAALSAAGLALTTKFAANIVDGPYSIIFLRISWACFFLAIVGFVIVFLSKIAIHKRVSDEILRSVSGVVVQDLPWYFHVGRYLVLVGFLAALASLALSLGVRPL